MKNLKLFFIILIPILPINKLRVFLYNFLFNYEINYNSSIGWLTIIDCNKFICNESIIKNFNFISNNHFELNNSEISFFNKIKDINFFQVINSKIRNNNKFIGEKKISKNNHFILNQKSNILDHNYFDVTDNIEIGENCDISSYIQIWTHGFSEERKIKNKCVLIKNNCTIKNACLISMGVVLCEKTTLENGTIVTKSILKEGYYFHELQKHT